MFANAVIIIIGALILTYVVFNYICVPLINKFFPLSSETKEKMEIELDEEIANLEFIKKSLTIKEQTVEVLREKKKLEKKLAQLNNKRDSLR